MKPLTQIRKSGIHIKLSKPKPKSTQKPKINGVPWVVRDGDIVVYQNSEGIHVVKPTKQKLLEILKIDSYKLSATLRFGYWTNGRWDFGDGLVLKPPLNGRIVRQFGRIVGILLFDKQHNPVMLEV